MQILGNLRKGLRELSLQKWQNSSSLLINGSDFEEHLSRKGRSNLLSAVRMDIIARSEEGPQNGKSMETTNT